MPVFIVTISERRACERSKAFIAESESAAHDLADNEDWRTWQEDAETITAETYVGNIEEVKDTRIRVVSYLTRDCGDGSEADTVIGTWGEMDTWGKREFNQLAGDPLYLFPDEVVTDVPAQSAEVKD